jgi:hypothetical protein
MLAQSPGAKRAALPPIGSATEAAELATHFSEVMGSLLGVVEEETKLVRAGRLREATRLAPSKSELARLYHFDAARVKACRGLLARHSPELVAELRRRHEQFRALLQINLTVLATAHAVAEGLVRGVSSELARRAAPQTYTAVGREAKPLVAAAPLALSRCL